MPESKLSIQTGHPKKSDLAQDGRTEDQKEGQEFMSQSQSGFIKKLEYRSHSESPRISGLKLRYFGAHNDQERIVVYTTGGRTDGLEIDYTVDIEHKDIIDKLNEIIDVVNELKGRQ